MYVHMRVFFNQKNISDLFSYFWRRSEYFHEPRCRRHWGSSRSRKYVGLWLGLSGLAKFVQAVSTKPLPHIIRHFDYLT